MAGRTKENWGTEHSFLYIRNRFSDSSSGTLRGRPDFPGVAGLPKTDDTWAAKRLLPSAKLPFVARRIPATSLGANS